MSRVDMLVSSKSTEAVKFFEFIRLVAADSEFTAIFFEGEDEKYYAIRLNSMLPSLKWRGINAEGKKNVIALRDMVRQHPDYCDKSCMFIVDADFDDNSDLAPYEDTYVTPCYSVENLYTSDQVLRRVLSAEFKITEHGDDADSFTGALEAFKKVKDDYHASILYFNVWIRAYRKNQQAATLDKLNINNVNFDHLADITLSGANKNYSDLSVSTLFPVTSTPDQGYIDDSAVYFAGKNLESSFRGKQQLEFFRIFLEKLKMDANSKSGRIIFKRKLKVVLHLTKANCLSELSNYADTPECFIGFVQKFQAGMAPSVP
ncbi:DUF4435 domain-containing protein [Pseudomonas paraversuta]|uniref:DUF4435 domain-containing protein n=1 Tax=Pseudomonas paraversuta TaxID=2750624 RepID=UPI003D28710C